MKQEVKMSADEVMISFKHIFLQCLRKLPFILSMLVILAILLPSVVFVKDYNAMKNDAATEIGELTSLDEVAIQNYLLLKNRLELLEEHEEASIFMKLDSSNVFEIHVQYKVEADESVRNEIARLLTDYVNSAILTSDMSRMEGFPEAKYLREVISVTSGTETDETTNGVFVLRIWAEDRKQGLELADASMELIEAYDAKLQELIGRHSLISIKEEGDYRWSNDIYNSQIKFYEEKQELLVSVKDSESQLTKEQKKVVNSILEDDLDLENKNTNTDITESKPSFSFKYVVVGGVVGIVLAVLILAALELFGGKIQTRKEVQERLGICHLAGLKIKSNTGVGKIIDKLFYTKEIEEIDSKIDFLTAQLKHCMKDGNNKVAILSSVAKKETESLMQIGNALRAKGIECELVDVTQGGSKAFAQMIENKNILLVEFVGESFIRDVYEEYEHCHQIEVNIIGYISVMK